MIRKLPLLLLLTGMLAGCGHDPYIHGPFLIGAEEPQHYPTCCRPGDVRSANAQDGWDKCMNGEVVHSPSDCDDRTAVLMPPATGKAESVVVMPRSSAGRSAWN